MLTIRLASRGGGSPRPACHMQPKRL